MLKNIFTSKVSQSSNISIRPLTETVHEMSDTDILDFLVLQEMSITQARIEHTRYTYLGEKEGSIEILTESASDFFDKIISFFKKLIAKIKEWFGKMFLLIQSLMGKTKQLIENNKDALLKKQANFVIQGYRYTIKSSSPNLKCLDNLVSSYNKETDKITKMKVSEISERRQEAMEGLGKLRAEVLGTGNSIGEGELRTEADKFYRDGDEDSSNINVDNAYIAKICSEYSDLDKTYGDCVKEKRKLELQLEGLKKYFESGSRQVKYVDGEKRIGINKVELKDSGVVKSGDPDEVGASAGTLKVLNAYYDYRFAESKEISNIILTVIDAKTRALRDQIKQYDTCIRKWIFIDHEPDKKGKDDNNDTK